MTRAMILGGAESLAAMFVAFALLGALFRAHVRRYERVVATDLLNDWEMQLELLDDVERERARLEPPSEVLAAMATLPPTGRSGLRAGWGDGPAWMR